MCQNMPGPRDIVWPSNEHHDGERGVGMETRYGATPSSYKNEDRRLKFPSAANTDGIRFCGSFINQSIKLQKKNM